MPRGTDIFCGELKVRNFLGQMVCNQTLTIYQFKYSLLDYFVLFGLQLCKFEQRCFFAALHVHIFRLGSYKSVEHALSSFVDNDHTTDVFAVGQVIVSQRLSLNTNRQIFAIVYMPLKRTRHINDLLEVDNVILIHRL